MVGIPTVFILKNKGECIATLVRKTRLMWIVEINRDFIVLLLLPKFDWSLH